MKKVFTNKNFSLLFFGSLVSSIGTTIYNFAISWYILDLTESPIQAGTYMATGGIVTLLLTPFCGVFADRFDKVKIVYITDFIRGLAIVIAGVVIFQDVSVSTTILVLYLCTIILSINDSLFNPAVSSLQTEIVKPEELQTANATISLINSLRSIIGILLGGTLYAILGIKWIFIVNGLSFIFSGLSEMFIKHPYKSKEDKLTFKSGITDMRAGLIYLLSKKGLIALLFGSLLLNFALLPLFSNGFPFLFNQLLKVSLIQYSYVQVAFSVGALLGAIVIGNMASKIKVGKSATLGIIGMIIVFVSIAVVFNMIIVDSIDFRIFIWITMGLMLSFGIVNMYTNIPLNTAFANSIEPEYRGRAFSFVGAMSMAATPFAVFIGGLTIEYAGLQALLYSSVVLLILIMIYILVNKNIRLYLKSID
ncbi:MFS transporter [Mycoplasmatota bacterium zrk1]